MRFLVGAALLLLGGCARREPPALPAAPGCAPGEYAHADPGFCLAVPADFRPHPRTIDDYDRKNGVLDSMMLRGERDLFACFVTVFRRGAIMDTITGPNTDDWHDRFDHRIRPLDFGVVQRRVLRRDSIAGGHGAFGVTEEHTVGDHRAGVIYDAVAVLDLDGVTVLCESQDIASDRPADTAQLDLCRTLHPR